MSRLPGENFKKLFFLVIRKLDISKRITDRSFNLGQLIEDHE